MSSHWNTKQLRKTFRSSLKHLILIFQISPHISKCLSLLKRNKVINNVNNKSSSINIIKCIWRNSMSYDFVYIYRVGHHIKCIYKLNRNRKDMGIQTMLSILTRFSVKHTLEKHVSITFSHFHYFVTNEHIFQVLWSFELSSSWNNKVWDVSEWQCLRFWGRDWLFDL